MSGKVPSVRHERVESPKRTENAAHSEPLWHFPWQGDRWVPPRKDSQKHVRVSTQSGEFQDVSLRTSGIAVAGPVRNLLRPLRAITSLTSPLASFAAVAVFRRVSVSSSHHRSANPSVLESDLVLRRVGSTYAFVRGNKKTLFVRHLVS